MKAEWYKDWFNSPYYHKLYFERDEQEAKDFINRLLDHLKLPAGSRVLDVACGKGRHSKTLAARGFDVTGIDISVDSIAFAKSFEGDKLHFFVHDMRLPFWVNYFSYAFNFFTSFGYFHTRREHDDAVRTIVNSLQPGGYLLIDYLNVAYAEAQLKPSEEKNIDSTTYNIERWHDERHFYKRMHVTDPQLTEPITFTEKVAKFSLPDFEAMLAKQGAQVVETFGNYTLQPYHPAQSPRLVVLAKKK